jgi:hypothetical protein
VDAGAIAATRGSAEEAEAAPAEEAAAEEEGGTTSSSLSLSSSMTTFLNRPAAPPKSFRGRAVAEDEDAGEAWPPALHSRLCIRKSIQEIIVDIGCSRDLASWPPLKWWKCDISGNYDLREKLLFTQEMTIT